jgi:cyclase
MLKRRIIPVELLHRGRLVKSKEFGAFRDVGDPLKSSQVYNDQDADELLLLNIDRSNRGCKETARYLRDIAKKCFMPITAGGGVRTLDDAKLLFDAGCDKVAINSAAYSDQGLLSEIAGRWGSQALVISIDVSLVEHGKYKPKSECGQKSEIVDLVTHIQDVIALGAGEIIINAIDRDGVMNGYDLSLIEAVRPICSIPLIVCGGAGNYLHLKQAFDREVNAVACGSLFNFGDNNPLRAKSFLKNYSIPLKSI